MVTEHCGGVCVTSNTSVWIWGPVRRKKALPPSCAWEHCQSIMNVYRFVVFLLTCVIAMIKSFHLLHVAYIFDRFVALSQPPCHIQRYATRALNRRVGLKLVTLRPETVRWRRLTSMWEISFIKCWIFALSSCYGDLNSSLNPAVISLTLRSMKCS